MFKSARLKLTLWYLLILCVVSASFSFTIYRFVSHEIDRFAQTQRVRLEKRFADKTPPPPFIDPDLVEETKARVIFILFSINGSILLISGALSYFLSGKTLEPIYTMLEEQKRFISDASHELKTPITSLKTSIEVALRDNNLSKDEVGELLRDNLSDINNLTNLTNSLLTLSRFENSSDTTTNITPILIKRIITLAIKRIRPQAKNKNIKIITKSGNTKVLGDETKLTELLVIILDNAIKYSSSQSVISLKTSKNRKWLHLSVSDQGEGIAKKDLSRIFERFYRVDKSRTGSSGFGLGLSIAKRIVESHNGRIKVTSQLQKGTTVDIYLPVKS